MDAIVQAYPLSTRVTPGKPVTNRVKPGPNLGSAKSDRPLIRWIVPGVYSVQQSLHPEQLSNAQYPGR